MFVPELSPEIADLKARVRAFVESDVYALESAIVESGHIDETAVAGLKQRARAAGFAQLNMPAAAGGQELSMVGQVAIEEEAGRATNGLGFAAVDRGPAELWEIVSDEQRERWVMPVVNGEYREAWAVTEPGRARISQALRRRPSGTVTSGS